MAKTTPWNKIKADYLNGVTPKELSEKYKIEITKLYYKIDNDSWAKEKTKINENIRNDVQEQIKELTNLALNALKGVLVDVDAKNADIVSASKAILDVSGLKTVREDVTVNQNPIEVQILK